MEAIKPMKKTKQKRERRPQPADAGAADPAEQQVPAVPTLSELLLKEDDQDDQRQDTAGEDSEEKAALSDHQQLAPNDLEEPQPMTSKMAAAQVEEHDQQSGGEEEEEVRHQSAVENAASAEISCSASATTSAHVDVEALAAVALGEPTIAADNPAIESKQQPLESIADQRDENISSSSSALITAEEQQQTTRTRMSEPPTAPPIYPAISELVSSSTTSFSYESATMPVASRTSNTKIGFVIPQISVEQVPASHHHYPDLLLTATEQMGMASRTNYRTLMTAEPSEAELLDEQQLLECYQNEQLEFVDDFVDVFCEQELEPRNSLYELVAAYKIACERIQSNEDLKAAKIAETHEVNNRVWTVNEHKITHQGKCGCDRSAVGETSYKAAQMHPELLVQLKEALDTLTQCELDTGFCQSVRASSLALQIQWTVGELRDRFFADHQLQPAAQPILLSKSPPQHSKGSRLAIRGALSDLFYFLRFPVPPQQFRQSLINWITELASVLLKACTADDQFFLLAHILRTPSPLSSWAAPLVQTFVTTPSLDNRAPMDSFLAMLSMLMQPVKLRERFLMPLLKYYEGENAWNVVNDEGDMDNANLAEISEGDWSELLAQFPVRPLLNVAFRHFTLTHQGHRVRIMYSLVSFVSSLLKILNEGLQLHGSTMKNLGKKIADNMSKIIHYFCTYWTLTRPELLDGAASVEKALLQNEVNRIVLQAVYYIVSKKDATIRQFLVDLPYGAVSENCRLRCQLLLRSPPSKKACTVRSLYDIPDAELLARVKSGGSLVDQLLNNPGQSERQNDDLTYTVSALASIISWSDQELFHFVTELIDICFLNEHTRDDFYKVGSEAMATLVERRPALLSPVLRYIDRHVDHLDDYAANILNNVPLHMCTLSAEDVTDRLGKWLIQRPVNSPASTIARRVLHNMNWSDQSLMRSSPTTKSPADQQQHERDERGESLWIPVEVHNICAETLVKAHFVQCKQRNSLIAKPLNKIARLASRCPDLEQLFDRFCWDVLLKLKISKNLFVSAPPNDLTAFFVHSMQKSLSSPTEFLDTGVHHFQELVNSACYTGAVAILARAVQNTFSNRIHLLTGNSTFTDCLERLLHADESSLSYAAYAMQFITGADKFPGPVLTLISSAISYQLVDAVTQEQRQQFAQAWIQLLTCPKPSCCKWNEDKCVLHLFGCLTKLALFYDPHGLFGLVEMAENLYKAQCQQWKESGRGPLSWFSTQMHPPLIGASLFSTTSPWATFLLLCAEQKAFPEFSEQLAAAIGKHPSRSLEESTKKASSRAHVLFTVDRLPYHRWLQFCCEDQLRAHPVFPLAIQQLATAMFERKKYEGRLHCPGWHFFKCKLSEPLFTKLRTKVLPVAEHNKSDLNLNGNSGGGDGIGIADGDDGKSPLANGNGMINENDDLHSKQEPAAPTQAHALISAFGTWLVAERCYRPSEQIANYGDLPMDYLLQMIASSGDRHIWTEFVDIPRVGAEIQRLTKVIAKYFHLKPLATSVPGASAPHPNSPFLDDEQKRGERSRRQQRFARYSTLTQFFSSLDPDSANAANDGDCPFPSVPQHQNLPLPDRLEFHPPPSKMLLSGIASALNPFAVPDTTSTTIGRFVANLDELNRAAKAFLDTKEYVDKSNVEYLELFQQLYKQFERKLTVTLRCGNLFQQMTTNRCARPAVYELTANPFEYQQEVAEQMNWNRHKRGEESEKLLCKADALAVISARLEHLCSDLHKLAMPWHHSGTRGKSSSSSSSSAFNASVDQQHLWQMGLSLFYRICSTTQGLQLLFPAGMDVFAACLRKLGSAFVAKNPVEQINLMRAVLGGNPLNHLLVDHFTPHCVQPPELLAQLYAELSASVRQPATSEAALALLRRLDIEHAGRQLPANQFNALMPVMFENLASVTTAGGAAGTVKVATSTTTSTMTMMTSSNPLRELCMDHFVHAMFHHFPHNFADGLKLALSGCDKQCIPSALFTEMCRRLCTESLLADQFLAANAMGPRVSPPATAKKYFEELGAEKALECARVVGHQFACSRRELNSRLFAVWAPYLEQVCTLADFFLRKFVQHTFRSEATTATMEKELTDAFRRAQDCWAPLLEPMPVTNLHPWLPSDTVLAQKVLDRLLRHLLWLPYPLYIPPDRDSPESLFWNYFATRLVGDGLRLSSNNSAKHIYSVYENKLTMLNWHRFWPTLLDLGAMDQLLFHFPPSSTSSTSHPAIRQLTSHEQQMAPIVAELLVRLPWPNLLQQYQYLSGYQPLEATRAFHSVLLSIFAKCLHRRENYTRSRASMAEKLKFLHDSCQWAYVKAEAVDRVGAFLADAFPDPGAWFTGPVDEPQKNFLSIWRQTCHFSTIPVHLPPNLSATELAIPRKRATFVRTQLRLMFRGCSSSSSTSSSADQIDRQEQLRLYGEMLDKANFVLISAEDKTAYLDMARELISAWADVFSSISSGQHQQNGKKGGAAATAAARAVLDQLYGKLVEWLAEHPDSPLVLLLASTAASALDKALPPELQRRFGLGIVDTCIGSYFKRAIAHQWAEIAQWVRLPHALREHLFSVPKSDVAEQHPHFLTLNAVLCQEEQQASSGGADDGPRMKQLKQLADFLGGLKPKHISTNEAAFLLCVQKWQHACIGLFTSSSSSLSTAHDHLESYIAWLQRTYTDEGSGGGGGGGGFFSMVTNRFSRRVTHSNRLQLLTHLMHLFLLQQQGGARTQPPRLRAGLPVMNGRLAAFQEIQAQKGSQEFASVLNEVAPHFTNASSFCLTDADPLFHRLLQLLYAEEKIVQRN